MIGEVSALALWSRFRGGVLFLAKKIGELPTTDCPARPSCNHRIVARRMNEAQKQLRQLRHSEKPFSTSRLNRRLGEQII
jgi:hypothetical protein